MTSEILTPIETKSSLPSEVTPVAKKSRKSWWETDCESLILKPKHDFFRCQKCSIGKSPCRRLFLTYFSDWQACGNSGANAKRHAKSCRKKTSSKDSSFRPIPLHFSGKPLITQELFRRQVCLNPFLTFSSVLRHYSRRLAVEYRLIKCKTRKWSSCA